MSSLTIAHVLSSFHTGGQERVALDLATLQCQAGHRVLAVSLATGPDGPNAAAFRASGAQTQTISKARGFDPSLPLRLAAFFAKQRVAVVHTHNPHALIYGAPAASLVRAVAVHTKHGKNPDGVRRRWLRRTVAKLLDAYVAVTPTLATIAIMDRECAPEAAHVIPNGIDAVRFAPRPEARRQARAELGIPEDAWVVGTVGRLSPEKDQALLIDAMTPLLDEKRRLVIVGDGPEREPLSLRVAATWRAEFVHMTGARSDVEHLLAAFDVFALTSQSEGLPLVLLEAMAMRLPVISTAVGGIPDLISNGVTGFLVPPGAREALAKQLAWLASRPAVALDVADVARHRVLDRHTVQRMAHEYQDLYERLLDARSANRKPSFVVGAEQ